MSTTNAISAWVCDRCQNTVAPGKVCITIDGVLCCIPCAGNNDRSDTTFHCAMCQDTHAVEGPESEICIPIHDHQVCFSSLHSRMADMTKDEDAFPAKYGEIELHPSHFDADAYGGEEEKKRLVVFFDYKLQEYRVPFNERVHCDCSAKQFLGHLAADDKSEEYSTVGCGSCGKLWCLKCRGESSETDLEIMRSHKTCIVQAQEQADEEARQHFEGLIRGLDYQLCPNCNRPIEQDDGCNHMTCEFCTKEFCYVCGLEAVGDSRHWSLGRCMFVGRDVAGAANGAFRRAEVETFYHRAGYPDVRLPAGQQPTRFSESPPDRGEGEDEDADE